MAIKIRFDGSGNIIDDMFEGPGYQPKREKRVTIPPYDKSWRPAEQFPDLSSARIIGFDTETRDPHLTTHGPGDMDGTGEIVGISLATDDWSNYYPIRHNIGHSRDPANMDPEKVFRYLRAQLGRNQPKVGANILYDLSFLRKEGVEVKGTLHDALTAEPLLDENALQYNLGRISMSRNIGQKADTELNQWCAAAFGGKPTRGAQAKNYWRCPAAIVSPYACEDAVLPILLLTQQMVELENDNLIDLFRMECDLIPVLLGMRHQGVRVDLDQAERVRDDMLKQEQELLQRLKHVAGIEVNPWAGDTIAKACEKIGLWHPMTAPTSRYPKGQPSFRKEWLEVQEQPFFQQIMEYRKIQKGRSSFIEGQVLNSNHNGVVYCSFHPLRSDEGGAVTGRFSSSNPNLQQVPSRDKILAPLIRGMFLPHYGQWRSKDYASIEFRLMAHAASGSGAALLRQQYIDDPSTDYHKYVQALVEDLICRRIERKPLKNLNFGLIFGMGKPKLMRSLDLPEEQATELIQVYHTALPYIRTTFNKASDVAQHRGYIKTILGRRRRFTEWESKDYNLRYQLGTFSNQEQATEACEGFRGVLNDNKRHYRMGVQRAGTHKALNAYTQGSAADIIKRAMVDKFNQGVYDVTGYPLLQVHDELTFSDAQTQETQEAFKEANRIMCNCVSLKVPLIIDDEIGPDWGHLKKVA